MNLLAVLGNPVAHSRSPEIHGAFARQFDIELEYRKILVPEHDFESTARDFLAQGAVGFNVTVPNKFDAAAFVDELKGTAVFTGAVNTVAKSGSQLVGYNTDGDGIVADITKNLGWAIQGKRVLVLGAGGAVKGSLPAILATDPELVHISNRTQEKAQALIEALGDPRMGLWSDAEAAYDLIISGASTGLSSSSIELPAGCISSNTACYDMIYGKEETPFVIACKAAGCGATSDGLGMLVEQAARAFHIWFDVLPDTQPVIEALRLNI